MPSEVYIGVGSNIDPQRNIADAMDELERRLGPVESSSAFRNPPVGFEGEDFLNLVLRAQIALCPSGIEAILNEIESKSGRVRDGGGPGPRSLDLDLLLYGSRVDPTIRLPHPDVLNYAFVLCPLAELVPHLVHPITGTRMKDAWIAMERGATKFERVDFEPASSRTSRKES